MSPAKVNGSFDGCGQGATIQAMCAVAINKYPRLAVIIETTKSIIDCVLDSLKFIFSGYCKQILQYKLQSHQQLTQ